MKVLIVAGGTGGHLYPGIALARALPDHTVLFAVRRGDLGREILQKEGFSIREISGQGLPRSFSVKLFTFPFKFLRGAAEAWFLLRQFRPDWVVGMGGYLSVPVILLAHLQGIKTLLHEQNAYPGLANRLLDRWSDSVAVSFPVSLSFFKRKNVWVSGLPVRPEMGSVSQSEGRAHFGLQNIPTFLVFGGSLGAQRLNTTAIEAWPLLLKKGVTFQVIHITGAKDFERVKAQYENIPLSAKVLAYCHSMPDAYAAADAVICRSGASTVAELIAVKRPGLFVPYPYATNDHQRYNAEFSVKHHLGKMITEAKLEPAMMADFLAHAITNAAKQNFDDAWLALPSDMNSKDAASRLAHYLCGGNLI